MTKLKLIICIFMLQTIFLYFSKAQTSHKFVFQASKDPAKSDWKPFDDQLEQILNGLYEFGGGKETVSNEFCFRLKDQDEQMYKIRFFPNDINPDGNRYPVYAMKKELTHSTPAYYVQKNTVNNNWQIIKHTDMISNTMTGHNSQGISNNQLPWKNITSEIHLSWQDQVNWEVQVARMFVFSKDFAYNQICYYNQASNTYENYAFYHSNVLQLHGNYNNRFKTGLDQCVGNEYIGVQWGAKQWSKRMPICILAVNNNINQLQQQHVYVPPPQQPQTGQRLQPPVLQPLPLQQAAKSQQQFQFKDDNQDMFIQAYKKKLKQKQEENDKMKQELETLKSSVDDETSKLQSANEKINQLTLANEECKKQLPLSREQIEKLGIELQQSTVQLSDTQGKLDNATHETAECKEQVNSLTTNGQQKDNDLAKCQQELQLTNKSIDDCNKKIEAAQAQTASLAQNSASIESLQLILQQCNESYKTCEQQVEQISSQLETCATELENLQDTNMVDDSEPIIRIDDIKQFMRSKIFHKKWPKQFHQYNEIDFERLANDSEKSYPIFHGQVIEDIKQFIKDKASKSNGNEKERQFFTNYWNQDKNEPKKMTSYMNRLLFGKKKDRFELTTDINIDDNSDIDGDFDYETHLTYEEMMFSAQLGVSSPTQFIGNCYEHGIGKSGVFISVVGATFDIQAILKYKVYFNEHSETYDGNKLSLRLERSLELFLFDANERGKQFNKQVYAYITGMNNVDATIWHRYSNKPIVTQQIRNIQKFITEQIIVKTQAIVRNTNLPFMNYIQFGFDMSTINLTMPKLTDNQQHEIHTLIEKEDIPSFIGTHCDDCLFVVMQAEKSSSDSAACSTIALTQNPIINENYINAKNRIIFDKPDPNQNGEYKVKVVQVSNQHNNN